MSSWRGTARGELSPPAGLPQSRSIDLAATPANLLLRRPEIIAAEASLAAADAGVAAALRDRLPRFYLAGLIGTIAGSINPLFGAAAFTAQGTGGLTYTVFDGGRTRAAIDAARADLAAAASVYQQTVLGAVADVEASDRPASLRGEGSGSNSDQALRRRFAVARKSTVLMTVLIAVLPAHFANRRWPNPDFVMITKGRWWVMLGSNQRPAD